MDLDRFYADKVTLFRKLVGRDTYGGVTTTWEKKYWNIPCRIFSKVSSSTASIFQVEGVERTFTHKMICNNTVDIRIGDKIENSDFSEVYIVISVSHQRQSLRIHHIEVKLSLTETEAEVT